MIIEANPYWEVKKYYGSIILPEFNDKVFTSPDGSIPFTIEIIKDRSHPNKRQWIETHHYIFHLKTLQYNSIRGKLKASIIMRIESEITKNSLKL